MKANFSDKMFEITGYMFFIETDVQQK